MLKNCLNSACDTKKLSFEKWLKKCIVATILLLHGNFGLVSLGLFRQEVKFHESRLDYFIC